LIRLLGDLGYETKARGEGWRHHAGRGPRGGGPSAGYQDEQAPAIIGSDAARGTLSSPGSRPGLVEGRDVLATEELWRPWCTATTCRSPSPNRRSPRWPSSVPGRASSLPWRARSGPRGQRRARPPLRGAPRGGICGCGRVRPPAATCFCTSMGTGPGVESGFDLALSELNDAGGHRFVLRVGTERGPTSSHGYPWRQPPSTTWRPGTRWFLGRPGRCIASLRTRVCPPCWLATRNTPAGTRSPSGVWPVEIARWCARPAFAVTCATPATSPARSAEGASGRHASTSITPISTGVGANLRLVSLPPVAHPQALDLVGPVRHFGLHRVRPVHRLVPGGHRHHRRGGGHPGDRRGRPRSDGPRSRATMTRASIAELVSAHPLLTGLPDDAVVQVAECASNVGFDPGALLLVEGGPADTLYLLRRGRVAIELHSPGHGSKVIETVGPGGIVGLSWLFPPSVGNSTPVPPRRWWPSPSTRRASGQGAG